ncbi:MAG: 4Fe-4S binding protein [Clostridia bacterium]|nr:4Fe-4S binding protein [Clostridia bacterium]
MKTKLKNFFIKTKDWFVRHKPTKRRIIQVYAALLCNANLKGFVSGKIYGGGTKYACTPGLNCYSCPGAAAACPLGALQNALASSGTTTPYYILGIIALFGLILGRTICGFLCPVGLGQELLYKIKTPKIKKNRVSRVFTYLKYVLLVALVIIIPIMLQSPTFCKYICPAGTFGGGIGLLSNPQNADFFAMLSGLFTWKFALLVAIIVLSIFCFRFFCRFLCPLGAIYGFFNKFALLGVKLDKQKCIDCGLCVDHCKMDIKHVGDHECINCGECISVCPTQAISWKGSKIFLHSNAIENEEAQPTLNSILENGTTAQLAAEEVEVTSVNSITAMAVSTNSTEIKAETADVAEAAPHESNTPENGLNQASEPIESKAMTKIKKRNKWLEIAAWALASVILIFALVYYNFLAKEQDIFVYNVGDPCPKFTVLTYEGENAGEFSTTDANGKVMVLNFWATWCTPCKEELPEFNELQENYSDDVVVVAFHQIGYEYTEVQDAINSYGWGDYSLIFAQDDNVLAQGTAPLFQSLGGKSVWPMTVVVDRDGRISSVRQGKISYSDLEKEVLSALNN